MIEGGKHREIHRQHIGRNSLFVSIDSLHVCCDRITQRDNNPYMCAYLRTWPSWSSASQARPWHQAREFASTTTLAASDASLKQWSGVGTTPWGEY